MGWGNCGTDSLGRQIGYAHNSICDEPGCKEEINRGLSYACGGMHGEDVNYCEKYFCSKHLNNYLPNGTNVMAVCSNCYCNAKTYAIEHPEDANELVAFFITEEGEDWNRL